MSDSTDELVKTMQARLFAFLEAEKADPASPISDAWRGPRSTEVTFLAFKGSYQGVVVLHAKMLPAGQQANRENES